MPGAGGDVVDPPAAPRTARARQAATRGSSAPAETEPPPEPRTAREEAPLPGEGDDVDLVATAPPADDEILDAEIVERVDEFEVGDSDPGAPPIDPEPAYEGPDASIERDGPGPSYTGPQILAMKAQARGLESRDAKLRFLTVLFGRPIESSKDLAPDEVRTAIEILNDDEGFADTRARMDEETSAAVEAPAEEAPATTSRRRRAAETPAAAAPPAPAVGPDKWDGDRWRAFLADRGVKVTELLKEAGRLAREADVAPPVTLEELAGSPVAGELVGFVEDLSLERRK